MDFVAQLAAALGPEIDRQKARAYGVKHDASGTPISTGYSHGPGGLLTFPGIDNDVFHTVMGHNSLLGQIPAVPTVYTNPTYYTITGVTAGSGSEKEAVCDDAPIGGLMKGGLTTSVFGRYERATPELEINRLGQRNDRADPLDLRLIGSPIASSGIFNLGTSAPADVLTNEVSRKFWELAIEFWRLMSRQLWAGAPANNSAGGGYKEWTGLSTLVNTGYKDAETGQALPALDSIVVNANYTRVDDENSEMVALLTSIMHRLKVLASGTGVAPVRWVFVMRSELFYHLTSIWPCSYYTYRCLTSPGVESPVSINMDAVGMRNMVDEMRAGSYLLIDGERFDVILDDGMPLLDGNDSGSFPRGCFASDMYILPMSAIGGQSTLFMEYFDYTNPSITSAINDMMWMGRVDGPFLVWPRQTNTCIEWQAKIEPRLVLRTPWLAARVQNVVYCPIQEPRQAFPDDPYFVNGGRTSRAGPSYYSHWQS